MRKFAVILLAFVLVLAFSLPVFATTSPTPTVKYSVTVISHEDGSVNGKSISHSVDEGDTVKIDVPESTLEFVNASIYKSDGSQAVLGKDYEIVDGSLTGNSVTIKPLADIVVEQFFEGVEYTDTHKVGYGENNRSRFVREGEVVTIVSTTENFKSFKVYLSDGKTLAVLGVDYELVDSKLTDKEIQIKPLTDIIVKEVDATGTDGSAPTGVPILIISLTVIAAAVVCIVAKKKAFN